MLQYLIDNLLEWLKVKWKAMKKGVTCAFNSFNEGILQDLDLVKEDFKVTRTYYLDLNALHLYKAGEKNEENQ